MTNYGQHCAALQPVSFVASSGAEGNEPPYASTCCHDRFHGEIFCDQATANDWLVNQAVVLDQIIWPMPGGDFSTSELLVVAAWCNSLGSGLRITCMGARPDGTLVVGATRWLDANCTTSPSADILQVLTVWVPRGGWTGIEVIHETVDPNVVPIPLWP
jgi:hypothetical protein